MRRMCFSCVQQFGMGTSTISEVIYLDKRRSHYVIPDVALGRSYLRGSDPTHTAREAENTRRTPRQEKWWPLG